MNYENIKINSSEYKKLSGIDKLKTVRFKLDRLFNEKDKKTITVIYNGEKKQISKSKIGYFKNLVEREKKLEKMLAYTNLKTKKDNSFNFLKAYVVKEFNNNDFNNLKYDEKIKVIEERKNYFHRSMNEKGSSQDVMEVIDYLEDLRIKLDIEKISGKVEEKISPKREKKEKKEKKSIKAMLLSLPLVSKIKNSFNKNYTLISKKLKKKKTRAAAAMLAGVIAFTGFAGLKSCNNKDNVVPMKEITTVEDDTTKVDELDYVVEDTKEVVEDTKEVVEDTKEEDTTIDFNDSVKVLDNSSIYTNSYDASYETNPCNALYDGSYERSVEGLSYELDGKIYTIYQNEDNAIEKVNLLVQSGAKLKAVLLTRTDLVNGNTHEGYYNADSVKVRMR